MIKKILKRLNIIDIIIIALVFTAALSISIRLFSNRPAKESSLYVISLLCENCPVYVQKNIQVNQECGEYDTMTTIGTIVTKETPFANTIRIGVKAEATEGLYGIEANDITFLIGDSKKFVSNSCVIIAEIENIKKLQ